MLNLGLAMRNTFGGDEGYLAYCERLGIAPIPFVPSPYPVVG